MAAYSLKFLLSILTVVHPVLGEYRKHSSILEASEGVQDWIVETRRWVPPTICLLITLEQAQVLSTLHRPVLRYRDLHKIPELGFEEVKTSQYIR